MKNDVFFKFLALVIFAGVILAVVNPR